MAYFKYKQVADQLLEAIQNGTYQTGDRIPKEEELCSQFNVGRQTLRSAVSQLEEAGYLNRIQGSGTYVCDPDAERFPPLVRRLREDFTHVVVVDDGSAQGPEAFDAVYLVDLRGGFNK